MIEDDFPSQLSATNSDNESELDLGSTVPTISAEKLVEQPEIKSTENEESVAETSHLYSEFETIPFSPKIKGGAEKDEPLAATRAKELLKARQILAKSKAACGKSKSHKVPKALKSALKGKNSGSVVVAQNDEADEHDNIAGKCAITNGILKTKNQKTAEKSKLAAPKSALKRSNSPTNITQKADDTKQGTDGHRAEQDEPSDDPTLQVKSPTNNKQTQKSADSKAAPNAVKSALKRRPSTAKEVAQAATDQKPTVDNDENEKQDNSVEKQTNKENKEETTKPKPLKSALRRTSSCPAAVVTAEGQTAGSDTSKPFTEEHETEVKDKINAKNDNEAEKADHTGPKGNRGSICKKLKAEDIVLPAEADHDAKQEKHEDQNDEGEQVKAHEKNQAPDGEGSSHENKIIANEEKPDEQGVKQKAVDSKKVTENKVKENAEKVNDEGEKDGLANANQVHNHEIPIGKSQTILKTQNSNIRIAGEIGNELQNKPVTNEVNINISMTIVKNKDGTKIKSPTTSDKPQGTKKPKAKLGDTDKNKPEKDNNATTNENGGEDEYKLTKEQHLENVGSGIEATQVEAHVQSGPETAGSKTAEKNCGETNETAVQNKVLQHAAHKSVKHINKIVALGKRRKSEHMTTEKDRSPRKGKRKSKQQSVPPPDKTRRPSKIIHGTVPEQHHTKHGHHKKHKRHPTGNQPAVEITQRTRRKKSKKA